MKFLSLDFEFNQTSEPNVQLVCVAVRESDTKSNKTFWLHKDPIGQEKAKKYLLRKIEQGYIFLAHAVTAEAASLLSLGIDPTKVVWMDTFIEFRMLTNHHRKFSFGKHYIKGEVKNIKRTFGYKKKKPSGGRVTCSYSQLVYKFIGKKIDTAHKEEMRELIISNPETFTQEERTAILKYCNSDTKYLLPCLKEIMDVYKKELRGRDYISEMKWRGESMARTAIMENVGYPISLTETRNFSRSVPQMLKEVQRDINKQFPDILPFEYNHKTRKFTMKTLRIKNWIRKLDKKIVDRWELTDSKDLSLSLDAFLKFFPFRHDYPRDNFGAQMVRYLHLKQGLNGFMPSEGKRTIWDSMGSDGRVRPYLNPYGSQSARYQPSAIGFIFLKAAWMRALVIPPTGKMFVGIDYKSEEFLINAIISKDEAMYTAYCTGDVYLAFAKDAGVVPKDGTKAEYPKERQSAKGCLLAGSLIRVKGFGFKKIEDITADDLVWSGRDWSKCGGAIEMGNDYVSEVEGISCTDDHNILTEDGWGRHDEIKAETSKRKVHYKNARRLQRPRTSWSEVWAMGCTVIKYGLRKIWTNCTGK